MSAQATPQTTLNYGHLSDSGTDKDSGVKSVAKLIKQFLSDLSRDGDKMTRVLSVPVGQGVTRGTDMRIDLQSVRFPSSLKQHLTHCLTHPTDDQAD